MYQIQKHGLYWQNKELFRSVTLNFRRHIYIMSISESPTEIFPATRAVSIPALPLKAEISSGWDYWATGTFGADVRMPRLLGVWDGKG